MIVLCILLLALLVAALWLLWRWARIIFLFEDECAKAIAIHERTVDVLRSIEESPWFVTDQQVAEMIRIAKIDVGTCRAATENVVSALTKFSQQNYIREQAEEDTTE